MSTHADLMPTPPPTRVPAHPEADALLASSADPTEVAARYPAHSGAWAALADRALAAGEPVAAYAYARVGYHRGLDALRRNGWKGFGPVPWDHEGNRGLLRAIWALQRAATAIAEEGEPERLAQLLEDCEPGLAGRLAGGAA